MTACKRETGNLLMLEFPLLNKDKKAISDLPYALQSRCSNFRSRIRKYYLEPLEAGAKLIEALKKEYHLK